MMTNKPEVILPWSNGFYTVSVVANPNDENGKVTPHVYVVTNDETGIQELFTAQLPQAFVYAVQSKSTIKQAFEMEKPSNVIPFRRPDRGPKDNGPDNGKVAAKDPNIKLN